MFEILEHLPYLALFFIVYFKAILFGTKVQSTYLQISNFLMHKIMIFFLTISLDVCFGSSKEPSQRDDSFEYQQHTFWLRKKKIHFSFTHSHLVA